MISEYLALHSTLEQLDSCLDVLEQKNDSLVSKLKELLDETAPVRLFVLVCQF